MIYFILKRVHYECVYYYVRESLLFLDKTNIPDDLRGHQYSSD